MKERLEQIRKEAIEAIQASDAPEKLNDVRVKFLGKKGELTAVLKGMKDVAPEERPKVGQLVNETRAAIEQIMEETKTKMEKAIREEKLKTEVIDVTLPSKKNSVGHRHPNTIALEEVERIFVGMGYEVVEGPEVEYDLYNFEKLNIPADHPAKDEQDTFYINKDIVLRTQTSPVQARVMEQGKLPIRMIAPGRVFRSDEVDATHSPSFHQIEGLVIDKNVSFADLKGTLEVFAKRFQLQERLTAQVADVFMEELKPQGVMVLIEAEHMCMTMRGVKKPGTKTVTVVTRGVFDENERLQNNFYRMLERR